jgi:hypothetical protein
MDLDDDLWIPFVWDTVYTMMNGSRQLNQDTSAHSHVKHKTQADQESQNSENAWVKRKAQADQESQNSENEAAIASITYGDIMYCDTPLSQIQSNQVSIEHRGESQSFSSGCNITWS